MANPLEMAGGPPVAPQQDAQPQNGLQSGPGPQGASQAAPAAPTHEQTVAALRHFHAINEELQSLLKDPGAGKSDLKSKITDGVVKLVAERMVSSAQAVAQLSDVPSDPLQQRKWLQGMLQQNVQAANAIVDHHAAGNDGTLDWSQESQAQHPHPDDHMQHMSALGAAYGGR